MTKKWLGILAFIFVLVVAGWGMYRLASKPSEKSDAQAATSIARVVNVDDVVNDPEKFAGPIGVEGTVSGVDQRNSAFTLGCEDACISMPVTFRGESPKEGANVVAYGEVKKTDEAKYVFVAREIKVK